MKFKFMSITNSKCKPFFHQYSYGFRTWFPALSLGRLHNCCIVSLTLMSAGQINKLCDFRYPAFSLALQTLHSWFK